MSEARHSAPRDALLSLAALILIAIWEASGWDIDLVGRYGNASGFAWRDQWLASTVLHDAGRWLAAGCLFVVAWDACKPLANGPSRRQRRYWLAVLVANLALIPLLKRFSQTSCPWDLIAFGGDAPYVPYWMPGITDGGPGHCFPAGHPVAAFAFFATWFLWRPYRPAIARCLLGVILLVGTAFAWAQLVRGAHFLGHDAWSAWLCWTLSVVAQHFAPTDMASDRKTWRPAVSATSAKGRALPTRSPSATSMSPSADSSAPPSPGFR